MDAFGLYSVGRADITVFSLPSLSALLFPLSSRDHYFTSGRF